VIKVSRLTVRGLSTRLSIPFQANCAYNVHEWLKDEQPELLTEMFRCQGIFQNIVFPT